MGRAIMFMGKGWRESPLGRSLRFSDIVFTVCGLKTGNNNNRNNTPATGVKQTEDFVFEHPLLHLFLLLLLTPVLKSVWGPFCLSMMSYLSKSCSHLPRHVHRHTQHMRIHTHTHTATACSTSVPQSSALSRGPSSPRWFFVAVTDSHLF